MDHSLGELMDDLQASLVFAALRKHVGNQIGPKPRHTLTFQNEIGQSKQIEFGSLRLANGGHLLENGIDIFGVALLLGAHIQTHGRL